MLARNRSPLAAAIFRKITHPAPELMILLAICWQIIVGAGIPFTVAANRQLN
jgi:hypothetical protein